MGALYGALQRGRWQGQCGCGLLRGGTADGARVRAAARDGGVGGFLGEGLRRIVCALPLVPLAVVARHGFGNSRNTQLSKENSD